MKTNFKALASLFLGALTLFSLSSCLNDDDDDSQQKQEWANKIIQNSLGGFTGQYAVSVDRGQNRPGETTSVMVSQDENGTYIEQTLFPIKEFAPSIDVPQVTAQPSDANYQAQVDHKTKIENLKNALASASGVPLKIEMLFSSTAIEETRLGFIPNATVKFDLTFADAAGATPTVHHYVLSQLETTAATYGSYPQSALLTGGKSQSTMNLHLKFYHLSERKGNTLPEKVVEFRPTEVYYDLHR